MPPLQMGLWTLNPINQVDHLTIQPFNLSEIKFPALMTDPLVCKRLEKEDIVAVHEL